MVSDRCPLGYLFQNTCMVYNYITVAAFHIYLSVVKMLLKGEVGGHALKSHGNYIADMENHGKIMALCF